MNLIAGILLSVGLIQGAGTAGAQTNGRVSSIATEVKVSANDLRYYNVVQKPEQIKCTFDHDPSIAIFVRLDMWTAQCLRYQKIRTDRIVIGHVQYGERNGKPLPVESMSYISTDGFDVALNNADDRAEDLQLRSTAVGASQFWYVLVAEKKAGNLGRHRVEIPVHGGKGKVVTIANQTDGQEFAISCETKWSTKLNGTEVGFYDNEFASYYSTENIGCKP